MKEESGDLTELQFDRMICEEELSQGRVIRPLYQAIFLLPIREGKIPYIEANATQGKEIPFGQMVHEDKRYSDKFRTTTLAQFEKDIFEIINQEGFDRNLIEWDYLKSDNDPEGRINFYRDYVKPVYFGLRERGYTRYDLGSE